MKLGSSSFVTLKRRIETLKSDFFLASDSYLPAADLFATNGTRMGPGTGGAFRGTSAGLERWCRRRCQRRRRRRLGIAGLRRRLRRVHGRHQTVDQLLHAVLRQIVNLKSRPKRIAQVSKLDSIFSQTNKIGIDSSI